MKVSVVMPAYNHERYIAQAIESVLCQKTDFEFELLIGEDDSTDQTRSIVRHYAEQNPDIIRPFYNSRERVIYIHGKATGRWNFINLMSQARGEHLAILEGDDFWLGEDKLQMQVDYLAINRRCSIVFFNAWRVSDTNPSRRKPHCRKNLIAKGTTGDLLLNNYLPTCTVMYRKNIVTQLPDWYKEVQMGDWPLHLLNSRYGSVDFLPEIKGVYRQHEAGMWQEARSTPNIARRYNQQVYNFINPFFEYQYESEISKAIALKDAIICLRLLGSGEISAAYAIYTEHFVEGHPLNPINICRFTRAVIAAVAHRKFGKKINL
jgi:glycosyltransferase involved in cell wall biosynthesis